MKLCAEYPSLIELYSIGKTLQGRDLWVVEVTCKESGPSSEKPGLWIDGNTHSSEPTGTNVCLKTIWYLCSSYGSDEFVTELLDTRVIYVLSRVNPDGAEVFLTKPYHYTAGGVENPEFWDGEGHYDEDVNGDGLSAFMRWRYTNGDWKISKKDHRLMIKREPEDAELVTGHEKVDFGHLEGRSAKLLLPHVIGADVVDRTRSQVEWVIKTYTDEPLEAAVEARCPRAGTHSAKVTLQ